MKPFSILLVTSSYLPIIGGSEIEAQRVSRALMDRGHRVEILCPGYPEMPPVRRWTDTQGIPVRISGRRVPARLRGHVFALETAWSALFRSRYDLVYFLMPGLQVALGALAARLAGTPFAMKFSGSNEIRRVAKSSVGRLQLHLLNRWAGAIMILNPGMAQEALECGLNPSRLLWMPNPVDVREFHPLPAGDRSALRARLHVPEDAEVVLYVGRLAPEKELPTLLGGFARVLTHREKALLVLVGDGPCAAELRIAASDPSLRGRVRFTGPVPSASVHEWMQIADLFALVSSLEGLPVSLIEAMASGLPSVVSGIPANRQLLDDGVEGRIVEPCDAEAAGMALMSLLADSEGRRRMGAAARLRVAANFGTDRVIAMYEELFAKMTGRTAVNQEQTI